MTRQEFIDGVTTWPELIEFCRANDLNACDDIIQHNALQQNIAEDMVLHGDHFAWTDIRDWLNDIDSDAAYYHRASSFEYEALGDEDFEDYKDYALEEADEACVWDDNGPTEPFIDDDIFLDLYLDLEEFTISEDEPDGEEPDLTEGEFGADDLLGLRSPVIKS